MGSTIFKKGLIILIKKYRVKKYINNNKEINDLI